MLIGHYRGRKCSTEVGLAMQGRVALEFKHFGAQARKRGGPPLSRT